MKRCMFVDDSSVIRKVAKRILGGPDLLVVEAATGYDALDMCAIDAGGEPITGVVWLIDDEEEIAAVSPRWGDDLACGY